MPNTTTPCDDVEVMRIWRECGLPEYFLGNCGTNHKLLAFVNRIRFEELSRLRVEQVARAVRPGGEMCK